MASVSRFASCVVHCLSSSPLAAVAENPLTGVRGISELGELYHQYTDYRLEILEERIRAKRKAEARRELAKRPFDITDIREFLTEQKEFIESMLEEIYEVTDD